MDDDDVAVAVVEDDAASGGCDGSLGGTSSPFPLGLTSVSVLRLLWN